MGTTGAKDGPGEPRWGLLLVVPTTCIGVVLGWAATGEHHPQASTVLRGLTLTAAALVLGLAALPRLLNDPRQVPEQLGRAIAFAAGLWTLTELASVLVGASEASATGVTELGSSGFADYLAHVNSGRVGALALGVAVLVTAVAAFGYGRGAAAATDPILALTALGLVARPVTGHMSQQLFGSVLDAAHALAASLWFGCLTALALTLRTRGAWAVALPRYSTWAERCVAVVVFTGLVDAALRLGAPSALFSTGYGRAVLGKMIALGLLCWLAWWWRRTWLPAAAGHRMTPLSSLHRATVEVALIAIVFGLAATLATSA